MPLSELEVGSCGLIMFSLLQTDKLSCLPALHIFRASSCKDAIPFSQLLRLLCHDNDDYHHRALEMLDFFRLRGYPDHVLASALVALKKISCADAFPSMPKQQLARPILPLSLSVLWFEISSSTIYPSSGPTPVRLLLSLSHP